MSFRIATIGALLALVGCAHKQTHLVATPQAPIPARCLRVTCDDRTNCYYDPEHKKLEHVAVEVLCVSAGPE